MTYFGGAASVRYKIANFAHGARMAPGAALTVPSTVMAREALDGLKPFNEKTRRDLDLQIQQIGPNLPRPITDDLEKYYHLFKSSRL